MSTPHGSKPVELTRYLANKFLSDSQRKKIKNLLYRLQRLPIRVLGVAQLIDSQKAEIERLKSRLAVLDGKLNLALYGLPQVGEYKATLISNGLVSRLDLGPAVTQALAKHRSEQVFEFKSALFGLTPKNCLILGLSEAAKNWSQSYPNVSWIEPDATRRGPGDPSFVLPTDFINALISTPDASQDLILCAHRYPELTPLEQLHLLELCRQKLAPRGVLCIEAADLTQTSDSYWAEPHCLRPYSASLLKDVLSSFEKAGAGKLDSSVKGQSRLFVFRKSG